MSKMMQELVKDHPARHRVFVAAAVEVLNEALAADPVAVNRYFLKEYEVNTDELRDHPSIQVGSREIFHEDGDATIVVRPLGFINGLFGAGYESNGFICLHTKAAPTTEDDWIDRFDLYRPAWPGV